MNDSTRVLGGFDNPLSSPTRVNPHKDKNSYAVAMLRSSSIEFAIAIGAGALAGFAIAFVRRRALRRALLPIALTLPLLPAAFELRHIALHGSLAPVSLAFFALIMYYFPILAFLASLIAGYQRGRNLRLDRQCEQGGLIE